ncbi:hypothetical protein SERLA73DRAFT_188905 [Serpula lacrymans var. lacrymans S7.3]|uniref:Carboxypeptidase n=2 Tax=Serpula lacrymans var. lacrymans TaxID=341189 RepID=F8QCD2_SERL3|nr:uncharacterized protein SERLADRAFT_479515 [Serpula lacrymans var. lacrymans S7.9]EGN93797.1 hypothetical protein SERLA73DRAFT_188905 [Serpula lacrymans var. lacrymans S7.3]EGO19168.1 hypothetical protein SERLADRAFT_479515 [Serpula lacrymans var. lacrymans S7.9]
MAAESYGGHYIPIFASEVFDQNARLRELKYAEINLTSIMIGNGLTDYYSLWPSYVDFQCSLHPFQSISACIRMKQAVPRCQKWTRESCIDQFDKMNCQAARDFCDTELEGPFDATGLNPYDIRIPCEGNVTETLCYPVIANVVKYLNRQDVRETIGIDAKVQSFKPCSDEVGDAFSATLDVYHETYTHAYRTAFRA